jgi:hypothetical protein
MTYSKYKNVKSELDGLKFGSKKELERYKQLKLLEKSGVISELKTQVNFELISSNVYIDEIGNFRTERKCSYIADFVYFDESIGWQVVEDVKGAKSTPDFIIKRKLMLDKYRIRVREIRNV